jgi:hypothetical protein
MLIFYWRERERERERDERTERDLGENLRRRMSVKGKRSRLYLY